MPFTFIMILSILFIASASIVFIVTHIKKQKRIMKNLAESTGATKLGNKMKAECDGVPYTYHYHPGSRNSPSRFTIRMECPSSGDFAIQKETGLHRFFKNIGVTREMQTGDPHFDQAFYINTKNPGFASVYFMSSRKRNAVQGIFHQGFTSVRHNGKTMEASKTPFQLKEDTDTGFVKEVAKQLVELSRGVPLVPAGASPLSLSEDSSWKAKRAIAFAIPVLLHTLGILGFIWGLLYYKPLDLYSIIMKSFLISIPALIVYVYIAAQLVKGRSSSYRELIAIFAISLSTFFFAGAGGTMYLNGALDKSSPSHHTASVLRKYKRRNKNSFTYLVVVSSWRKEGTERLSVSASLYRSIPSQNGIVEIATKPGRFGYEWIVTIKPLE